MAELSRRLFLQLLGAAGAVAAAPVAAVEPVWEPALDATPRPDHVGFGGVRMEIFSGDKWCEVANLESLDVVHNDSVRIFESAFSDRRIYARGAREDTLKLAALDVSPEIQGALYAGDALPARITTEDTIFHIPGMQVMSGRAMIGGPCSLPRYEYDAVIFGEIEVSCRP